MKKLTTLIAAITLVLSMGLVALAPVFANEKPKDVSSETRMEKKAAKVSDKTIDASCVKTAVDARETGIKTAFDKFTTTVSAAFAKRKTALAAAWSLTDRSAIKSAVKTAWTAFEQSKKEARKAYNEEIRKAWGTFKDARKTCKTPGLEFERSGSENL